MSKQSIVCFTLMIFTLISPLLLFSASYTVKKGDTLYGIARKNSIDVTTLSRVNPRLEMGILLPGQELIIPRVHKVKPDETLYSISSTYDIPPKDLILMNSLKNSHIQSGQVLILEKIVIKDESLKTPKSKDQNLSVSLPVRGAYHQKKGIINGLLISSQPGETIESRSSGLVVWTDENSLLGSLLIVAEDDATLYIYGGNAVFDVNVGEAVKRGSMLGNMAEGSENPELLFSVYQDGEFRGKLPKP